MLGDNLNYALCSSHNKYFVLEDAGVTDLWIVFGLQTSSQYYQNFERQLDIFLEDLQEITKC